MKWLESENAGSFAEAISMHDDDSFFEVNRRMQSGDEHGASVVFDRFAKQLIAKAKGRLNPKVRQKVDPEDVVQSVFRSFFLRQTEGQFELNNWESLWGLLLQITLRKCSRCMEYYGAQRRNLNAETAQPPTDQFACQWEAASPDPMPSEIAILNETIDAIKADLNPEEREIFALRLQDYDQSEIASMVQRSERTVRRVLARVRDRLTADLSHSV